MKKFVFENCFGWGLLPLECGEKNDFWPTAATMKVQMLAEHNRSNVRVDYPMFLLTTSHRDKRVCMKYVPKLPVKCHKSYLQFPR